jgi:general secretion pathway protein E
MTNAEEPGTRAVPPDVKGIAASTGLRLINSADEVDIAPDLVVGLPVEWARKHGVLPVRCEGALRFLTSDPSDLDSLEYLAMLAGEHAEPLLASPSLVASLIETCYFSRQDSRGELIRDMETGRPDAVRRDRGASDLLQMAEKAPVTQLVNVILLEALKRGASDVHVEPLENRLRIRYRIDGVLYEQAAPPKHVEDALVSRLKVMAHMDIAERRLPQDGTARVRVGEREIDVRVSTVPVAEGERVVLRLLDRDSALLPLSRLGMSGDVLAGYMGLLELPNGIVVVSGPTGSGKTTTLYASLRELDSAHRNILTVEDPIEYQLPDIGQIQVKPKIGLTFAAGLRHILRQDPDIVLVGETRDLETAEIAIRASLTGHLVFTTLHTNDAAGSVLRLVDMGVEPYLLASCLRGVLAQRLVRRLCPACRRETTPDPAEIVRAGPDAAMLGDRVWDPVGCGACLDGFRGRTGLFEFLKFSETLSEHVRGGQAGAAGLRQAAIDAGMSSLLCDGLRKVASGTTSLAEVLAVAI